MELTFTIFLSITFVLCLAQSPPAQPKSLEELAPLIPSAEVLEAEPLIRQDAKRSIVRFGPFTLPALPERNGPSEHQHTGTNGAETSLFGSLNMSTILQGNLALAIAEYLSKSMDPEGVTFMNSIDSICKDCTIIATKTDVVFKNGTRADISSGVYLHHIISFNMAKRRMGVSIMDGWLPGCSGTDRMVDLGTISDMANQGPQLSIFTFGAVDEFKQMFYAPDSKPALESGHYFGQDDKLFFQAEMINYRKEQQEVYVQIDAEYMPSKFGSDSSISFSSVTGCNEPNTFSGNGTAGKYIGKDMIARKSGKIIGARGHMHDGGEGMIVYLNGELFCNSTATYGDSFAGDSSSPTVEKLSSLEEMSTCYQTTPVKKGDRIRLEALYDKAKHPLRQSAGMDQLQMGLVAFTFVPDSD